MSINSTKPLPFTKKQIGEIVKNYPTPFYIYDEEGMLKNVRKFLKAFSILPGFKEYFAVKATPNPFIMKLLKKEGLGADCSSFPELLLAQCVGITGEDVMFTSNDTPAREYIKAKEMGAIINVDDISHLAFLEKNAGLPDLICFRYNPGPLRGGNIIIGDPKEAKYGFTKEQLFEGYALCKKKGVKRFGLHTMIVSNELQIEEFQKTAQMLFGLVIEIHKRTGINLEFVNLGGGIGIPYKPEQKAVDYDKVAQGIKVLYEQMIVKNQHHPLKIYLECGRVITGPYGFLVTTTLHLKHIYKDYVGVDACMANLMRPAIYGAYHHITVLGKEKMPCKKMYDVTGSLCENNDKFAINRKLPEIAQGDILVIHDVGAHGHAMGFQYNGKLRSAELLLRGHGTVVQIRRQETPDDYFSTLDFKKMQAFR
ncbi:diaminopimelate decarboxylase [Candidatus Woesearchaeota archaeon]|nr:diaminopimelate decarboxylase [Candidatus Woesearchaeota archaeon]